MNNEKESSLWRWIGIMGVVGASVLGLWLASWALITWKLNNPTMPGEFGDMFGAVNSLFSGLAFAGIILAILLQREELKLQRKELNRSTKAQKAQERALVIAAQLDANVALLEHIGVIRAYESEQGFGDPVADAEYRYDRVAEMSRLLRELNDSGEKP